MPTHQHHLEKEETYFITFTCYKWMNLFQETNLFEYFEIWFQYLHLMNACVLGYVIMPNHFHGLIHLRKNCPKTLNQLVGNGKRFLAYEIVKRLRHHKRDDLLSLLRKGVQSDEKNKGKKHQIFRLSFDAKICHSIKMVETKLDYIHHNPVSRSWRIVDDWATYPYSSARYYELGNENKFVIHFKDIWG